MDKETVSSGQVIFEVDNLSSFVKQDKLTIGKLNGDFWYHSQIGPIDRFGRLCPSQGPRIASAIRDLVQKIIEKNQDVDADPLGLHRKKRRPLWSMNRDIQVVQLGNMVRKSIKLDLNDTGLSPVAIATVREELAEILPEITFT
jgi:hypothetical protein